MEKHQLNTRVSNYISLVLLVILAILQTNCNVQINNKPKLNVSSYKPKFITEKELGKNAFDASYQMKIYADSLNMLGDTDSLPSFIFNTCFDNQPIYWENLHTAISLRKMILDGVTNKMILEKISNNKILNSTCKNYKEIKIPLLEKSFSELAKERLAQL